MIRIMAEWTEVCGPRIAWSGCSISSRSYVCLTHSAAAVKWLLHRWASFNIAPFTCNQCHVCQALHKNILNCTASWHQKLNLPCFSSVLRQKFEFLGIKTDVYRGRYKKPISTAGVKGDDRCAKDLIEADFHCKIVPLTKATRTWWQTCGLTQR